MKKSILPLLAILILSLSSVAQNKYPSYSSRGNENTVDSAKGMVVSGKGIRITNYVDTGAANVDNRYHTYPGATIYTSSNKKFWISDGLKWVEVGSGGSGGTTVTSFGKNASRDSIILVLSDGTRFAAKDSVGAGGGSGSIEYVLQGYGIKVDSTGRNYTIRVDTALVKTVLDARADSVALAGAIATKEPIITILPVAKGGTGTATPSITAGTNITSVTGTWPNVTINAATQGGTPTDTTSLSNRINNSYYSIDSVTGQNGFQIIKPNGQRDTVLLDTSGSGTGSIEYLLQGYGIKVDSAGRVYTVGVDSFAVATRARLQKVADSLSATAAATYATISNLALKVNISDTAAMLQSYKDSIIAHNARLIGKQPLLTAGTNITIVGSTISATGGGGSGEDTTKIPLSGTVSGKPVTGDIEITEAAGSRRIYSVHNSGVKELNFYDDAAISLRNTNPDDNQELSLSITPTGASIISNANDVTPILTVQGGITSTGIRGYLDFSPNYDSLTYVQKKYVDRVADSLRNYADSVAGGGGSESISTFGTIFTDDFTRGSIGADYSTTLPGTTLTMPGTYMQLSGSPNNYANFVSRNYYTTLDRGKVSTSFKIQTVDANSHGLSVGWRSAHPTFAWNVFATLSLTSTTQLLSINGNTLPTLINDGVNVKKTISSGDSITLSIERNRFYYIVTYLNHTTGDSKILTQLCTSALSPFVPHNTSRPTIIHMGGTIDVSDFSYTSNETKEPKAIFVGNSVTFGQNVTDVNGRFPKIAFKNNTSLASINAGGADATAQILLKLPEIASYDSGTVFLMVGANDILYSVPSITWQTNYDSIVTYLHGQGKGVIHLTPTPRNAVDVTPLRTWLYATYPNDSIIDTYTLLKGATNILHADYNSGDNIHPNQLGQTAMGNYIAQSAVVAPMINSDKGQSLQQEVKAQDITAQQLYVSTIAGDIQYKGVSKFDSLITANNGLLVGGGSYARSKIYKNGTIGLTLAAFKGSTSDFAILDTNGTARLSLSGPNWTMTGARLLVGGVTLGTNTTNSITTNVGNYGMWIQGSTGTNGDLLLADRNGSVTGSIILKTDGMVYGSSTKQASAKVEIVSTTQGFLLPRMTAAQGAAIASPSDGLMIYVTSTDATFTSIGFWGRVAGVWTALHL